MLLKKLIKNLSKEKNRIDIKGLEIDSRKVKKDFIFFAVKGLKFNGEKFINEAVNNGAVVIVCSKNCKYTNKKILVIKKSNVRYFLSEISSKFYKDKPKNIIAVTGTNGKTSVADLFYQILKINKIPVASIGTLGIKSKNRIIKSELTSPDTILLHKSLEKIKKDRINNVIIEASSHGIHQKRMSHLNFKAGIFTNFSQDHLDYHKTMKSYLNAKLFLFEKILFNHKSIISDSAIPEFLKLKRIAKKRRLRLIDVNKIKNKIPSQALKFTKFQIINLSMAIEAAKLCGLAEKKIFSSLKKIKDVNGRLELVKTFSNNVKVYVDFAHTPDALKKVLDTLKDFHGNNITLVFGCGGDRDIKKRPLMARVASENCKKIYVTDDNPRNEKPEKIRKEIIKNIKNKNYFNVSSRKDAIKTAILNSKPNEVILIAGKGHETHQIYKKKIISFSDKKIIKNINLKQKKMSDKDQTYFQNKNILKEIKIKNKLDKFHGIAIDSRLVKKNNLFLTIKGKKNDGLNFIPQALRKGAKYIVSSTKIKKNKGKIIKVNNEIKFLNNYAITKRYFTSAQIIAITGSAGKTSLKNLLSDLLQNFGKTHRSPLSYNNHFGVPLSLSNLTTDHKFGVFEVGMSKSGEINKLSKIIKPHIGIITNIGEAHIENFKNKDGIAKAKAELIDNIQRKGTIILNYDDKYFRYLEKKAKSKNLNIVSFGMNKKSNIHPIKISKNGKFNEVIVKTMRHILKLKIKDINFYNVLSSIASLELLNLDLKKISKYFKTFEPSHGRGKIHKIFRYNKNFKLIDESYNANPLSVKNAIDNFNNIKKHKFKKYLLLGDMLELGKKSRLLHKNLSKVINNSDIDKVFIKGTKTIETYKHINQEKRGNIFQQEEDVDFNLKNIIANNDYLMIKGSNATGLNKLSKKIIRGF